ASRGRAAPVPRAGGVPYLDARGAGPGEGLGDGVPRLELREINHLDADERRLHHGLRLWQGVHIPYLEHVSSTGASHSIHFPTRTCRVDKGGFPRANWTEPPD